jgi:fagellar hook-basal body proteins
MDVIGNNIANVNTSGFKGSDVTFKEAYVSTMRSPAPGTPGMQVGLGTQVGGILKNFKGGILMETGQSTNMGMSGEGFFAVAEPSATGNVFFTRAGDFLLDVDPAGPTTYVINPDGKRLQCVMGAGGFAPDFDTTVTTEADLVDLTLPADMTSLSIGLDGVVYVSQAGAAPTPWARLPVVTFSNNSGLEGIGSNLFKETTAAGIQPFKNAGGNGRGQIFQGYIENSNVDLAQEFTNMIITQRGFQANSRTITASDELLQELLSLKR